MPAISVIIPMYNVEKYIGFCMDSVLGQTFKDFEIIMLDDASTDGTWELCRRLYEKLPGVFLIKGERNLGRGAIRNKGIGLARGKYLYFLDSDDELLPQALEILYKAAEAHEADVIHTNLYMEVYTESRMLPRTSLWKVCRCGDITEGCLEGDKAQRLMYQGRGSQPMPWLNLYRKDFLLENKIVFPDLPFGEDNIFSVEVALKAKCFYRINKELNLYRFVFKKKEREIGRLQDAFAIIPQFLAEWSRLLEECPEEEMPFDTALSFMRGWIRAHLRYSVYNIMSSSDRESFLSIKEKLFPIVGRGNLFTALLINMLEEESGERLAVADCRNKKISAGNDLFAELDRKASGHQGDYAYIYSEARQALELEGTEDEFKRKAGLYLARASLGLARYEEALAAYDKALLCADGKMDIAGALAAEKLSALRLLEDREEVLSPAYAGLKECFADYTPYAHGRPPERGSKIRLGLLADCFCRHEDFAAAFAFLFCYDKEHFEVYCYYLGQKEDDFTGAIRSQTDGFVPVAGLSCREAAERIHADRVDALIDLTGYGLASAMPILAYRPAPLQIGGPAQLPFRKSGLFDYIITDDIVSAGKETGSLWRLPCAVSYAMRDDVVPSRRAPVTVKGYITLGVSAYYCQISDEMLMLWREIMDKLPDAKLILKLDEFKEKAMLVEAGERLSSLGFDMARVQMEGTLGDILPRYLDMDILLATYPSIPCGKFLDALYMGVPVVSLYGPRGDTRLGLSILSRVGLEDLAVDSQEEYVAKVISLAEDRKQLDTLHKNLRTRLEPAKALNPAKYIRALEMRIREAYLRVTRP